MPDPLVTHLQSESCKPLLAKLIKRAERGKLFSGTLALGDLSEAEREGVGALTGQTCRGRRVSIDTDAFDEVVRNTGRFQSLRHLVETAVGHAIENKQATKQQQLADWQELWEWAARRSIDDPRRQRWLNDIRQSGWLKARSRNDHQLARQMLSTAAELLDTLPADGIPLAVFAATHIGDAHALDPDRDLGRLMCRGIASIHMLPTPKKRSDLRRLWELIGIVPDELSVTVLVLNLHAIGNSLTDKMLRAHAACGEPCRLTFRQLRLHAPTIESPGVTPMFVCENPSIVASAAERLGVHCRPLICVEGQPNLAAWRLLTLATSANWKLAYHGDFDWGGIRIANQLYHRFGFTPWRFDTTSYEASSSKRRKLRPPVADALWDPTLSPVMAADGRALEEEQVLGQLLMDLDARVVF